VNTRDCQNLADQYKNWLAQDITVESEGDVCVLTVPFLDRHRDFLQIYIRETSDGLVLSDDGYVIRDLRISGLDIDTPRRESALNEILRSFDVSRQGDELVVSVSSDNPAQRKHDLLQAMLAVGDLIHLAQPTVSSVFKEDVQRYLSSKGIPHIADVSVEGESGLSHSFDIVIAPFGKHPERYLKSINIPRRENIVEFIFSWQDAKIRRPPHSQAFVILNDELQPVGRRLLDALDKYEIHSIPWSDRVKSFNVFEREPISKIS
jgi:hypothetical protein